MGSGLNKGHTVLAVLAAAAAVWAYLVTHPLGGAATSADGGVRVWDVPVQSVTALRYQDGVTKTVLTPDWAAGAAAPYIWVEADSPGHRAAPPKPKPPGKEKVPPQPESFEPEHDAFRGNATAQQTLEQFAALSATRDLGRLESLDAARFGLPNPEASLELERKGEPALKLELGRVSFGNTGRYAHSLANGHVYLLRAPELRRLSTARGTLMDRELLDIKPEDVARVELQAGGASRTLHRLAEPNQWGVAPDAGAAVADASVLMSSLQSLRALRYGAADGGSEVPAGTPALEVRLFRAGSTEPAAWLRLYAGEGQTVTVVSSYTRRPVQVPRTAAGPVLEKARMLLRGT